MTTHDKFGAAVVDDDYLEDGYYNGLNDEILSILSANSDFYYKEALDTSSASITLTAGKTYTFTSMNVVTNDLELTGTSTTPTVFIVDGNVVISATIDGTGNGFVGGIGGNNGAGANGSSHTIIISAGEGHGLGGAKDGGTVGAAGVFTPFVITPSTAKSLFNIMGGAGAGGGGSGSATSNVGATGGAGGAGIIIICKGNFNGAGGTIDVSGDDGAGGAAGNSGGAGGGGGAGGMIVIAYGGTYSAATYTIAGGSGGAGAAGGSTGGAGGGGGDSVGGDAVAGSANAGGTGGAGGAGSSGASYIFEIDIDRG